MEVPMNTNCNKTIIACFIGYIVQAIVNNFAPLLFLTFQQSYHIPLSQITLLVTLNFLVQLTVDLLSVGFIDRIGYRASAVLAHIFCATGLLCLAILPELFKSPYEGILIAVVIYALGGGLLEVLVSPIVEACPTDHKEKTMSLLHSFYCWGHVGVVLISTLFFTFIGIAHWKFLTILWALIPIFNAILFLFVPITHLIPEDEKGMSVMELFRSKTFWLIMLFMLCAGASEQGVSQWASIYAEKGLSVTKTVGDLAGPMCFAVLMGTSRAIYGKLGHKIHLHRYMIFSSLLCIICYLTISFSPNAFISLIACAVCGLSVGIMWPGSFSIASASLPKGGTSLFAFLALAGDIGCSGGPTLVGFVADSLNDNLKLGILSGTVFPLLLLIGLVKRNRKCPIK